MIPKISKRWPGRSVESFFNVWTPNMAYVLGYFSADGSMYKNSNGGCYISFTSSDLILIETIKSLLHLSNKIEIYQPNDIKRKIRYALQIGSKIVFKRFLDLGLTPAKSLTLILPPIRNSLLKHFVRGYFDGDGCVFYGYSKRKNRKGYMRHLQINIRCGSKQFLESLQDKLAPLCNLNGGSLYFHSRAYSLAYSGQDVVKLYSFMYPSEHVPCLERKRNKLRNGIKDVGPKCNGFARFPVTE